MEAGAPATPAVPVTAPLQNCVSTSACVYLLHGFTSDNLTLLHTWFTSLFIDGSI